MLWFLVQELSQNFLHHSKNRIILGVETMDKKSSVEHKSTDGVTRTTAADGIPVWIMYGLDL